MDNNQDGKHYVCTGECGGVSDQLGSTCQAEGCNQHGQPLVPCDCTDDQHGRAHEESQEEE